MANTNKNLNNFFNVNKFLDLLILMKIFPIKKLKKNAVLLEDLMLVNQAY